MTRLFDPAKRQERAEAVEKARTVAPMISGKCVTPHCICPVTVVLASVVADGQKRTGPGSQFMDSERRLRHGVEWVRWVEYCSKCYSEAASKVQPPTKRERANGA